MLGHVVFKGSVIVLPLALKSKDEEHTLSHTDNREVIESICDLCCDVSFIQVIEYTVIDAIDLEDKLWQEEGHPTYSRVEVNETI